MAERKPRNARTRLQDLITPFVQPSTRVHAVIFTAASIALLLLQSERNAVAPWPIAWSIPVLALISLTFMSLMSQNLSILATAALEMRRLGGNLNILTNYPEGHPIDWMIVLVLAIQVGTFYRLHRIHELEKQKPEHVPRQNVLPTELGILLVLMFIGLVGAQTLWESAPGMDVIEDKLSLPPSQARAAAILWASAFAAIVVRLLLFFLRPSPSLLEATITLNDILWLETRSDTDRVASALAKHQESLLKKRAKKPAAQKITEPRYADQPPPV